MTKTKVQRIGKRNTLVLRTFKFEKDRRQRLEGSP